MNILSFAKLGITVISGLILSMGSVGNYTTSPITAEENLDAKGCTANFENKSLIPFYFDDSNGYSQSQVEDLNNWKPAPPNSSCKTGNNFPCMILADEEHVDDPLSPSSLLSTINLQASPGTNSVVIGVASNSDFENRGL